MRIPVRAAFLAVLLSAGFAGAASAQYAPVPPPRFERVPPPPRGPGRVVWEPGHWRWDGRAYAWDPGRYVGWRREYRRYVPGGWVFRGGTRVWVPAHWG